MGRLYVPKEGARRRVPNDPLTVKCAVEEVRAGGSLKGTAKKFGMNVMTLKRIIRKGANSSPGYNKSQIFNKHEEGDLTRYLIRASKLYYGLPITKLRELAYEFGVANNKTLPPSWVLNKKAGKDWARGFLERNSSLSLRTPEATSLARATAFNQHTVGIFFQNLRTIYERYNFPPQRIWNVDETGVTTVHTPRKIIAEKGVKQIGKVTSGERGELVTVCATINASGNHVPPFFIFPRVNWQERMTNGAPPGSSGVPHSSGWMTGCNFIHFLNHFKSHTQCSLENQHLIIMDNHDSHVSVEVINFARNQGIVLFTIPPHTSHKLQPLDRTVFGPLKAYFNTAAADWMTRNPGRNISIYDIAGLIGCAYPKAFSYENIISGFRASGIFPFNSNVFSEDEFLSSEVTDRPNPSDNNNNIADSPDPSHVREKTPEPQVNSYVSPEVLKPFPKAPPRSTNTQDKVKGRKRGRSRILTDTPEKLQVEEEQKKKENKKIKKNLPKKKKLSKKYKKCDPSSSEEEPIEKMCLADSSELDSDFFDPDPYREKEVESNINKDSKINVGDFVIVKFLTKKSLKHFAAKIVNIEEEEYAVNFLKKKEGVNCFYFPEKRDESYIKHEDLVVKLQNTSHTGTTSRTSGFIKLPHEFLQYFS